jgi:hypothetical protein
MPDPMHTEIRRNTLKAFVGRHLDCQLCRRILDARTTVLITPTSGGCNLLCEDCTTTPRITAALDAGASIDHWNWHRSR